MSYSNYQLNQRINNLQNQINNLPTSTPNLQAVLDVGYTANADIELVDEFDRGLFLTTTGITSLTNDGYSDLNYNKLSFNKDASSSTIEYTGSTDTLDITTTNINLIGQTSFDTPPHSTTPILGNDLTTKDYVDSLVGQYSGGYNLYLNYSETLEVNSITYKYLSNEVSSATQQDVLTITDGTDQLIATFITDEINILEIPTGLWNMTLYGSVSGAGGVLYYYYKIKKNSGGAITDLITSGFSPDVNATPTGNPDAYHMSATIDSPINVLLTDRIIIEIYCKKISGTSITLNTYFESSYYSFIQTTLNAGTTLLTSSNNWTGNNNFELIPTTQTATAGSNDTKITTTAYIFNALSDYLTSATASATYATLSSLSAYLTTATASATYATISSLSSYLTTATASTLYYTKSYIELYFLSRSEAMITYATIDTVTTDYLSKASAIATYAPLAAPSFIDSITVADGGITITNGGLTLTNALMLIKAGLVGPATNGVSFGLCSTQTTGILNIGTGARTTTGTINIGTGAGGTLNPINVGSGSSTIALNGTVSLNKALTLPTVSVTPTATQLGYTLSTSTGPSIAIGTTLTGLLATSSLAIGIYMLIFQINIDTITSGVGATITISFPVTGGCSVTQMDRKIAGITNGQSTGGEFTGILTCTTATNSCIMSMICSPGTAIARLYKYSVIKIA
jgi:hypothetical protein